MKKSKLGKLAVALIAFAITVVLASQAHAQGKLVTVKWQRDLTRPST